MEWNNNIIEVLAQAFGGKDTLYIVGGYVRDTLLGITSPDIDFATPMEPDRVKQILDDHGLPVYTIGEKYGTVGTRVGDVPVEITTFRTEEYHHDRHPEVKYVQTLQDDLQRRDFTINAIAIDTVAKTVFDPFDGMKDIQNKVVRAVGEPSERFREDPLRLLRLYRFAFRYQFHIDSKTEQAAYHKARSILSISAERQRTELEKILLTLPRAERYIDTTMFDALFGPSGVGAFILPEVAGLTWVKQPGTYHGGNTVLDHVKRCIFATDSHDPLTLWAILLHDIGKPATYTAELRGGGLTSHFYGHDRVGANMFSGIADRLRFSNKEKSIIQALIGEHMCIGNISEHGWSNATIRRLYSRVGDNISRLFELVYADLDGHTHIREGSKEKISAFEEAVERYLANDARTPRLPKGLGDEIMTRFGIVEGPQVGEYTNCVKAAILDDKLPLEPTIEESITYLEENM